MRSSIAIVGVNDGLVRGKIEARYFLPPFQNELLARGIAVSHCSFRDFILSDRRPDAAVFLYSEGHAERTSTWEMIDVAAKTAQSRKVPVVQDPSIGRIVANKKRTNRAFVECGVATPRMVSQSVAAFRVFSNEIAGTQAPTSVVEAGRSLDQKRYNTELIDTVHEHRGQRYFVVLRVMAVGPHCISIYLRLRPVEQGSASVHSTDTPLDAGLWNTMYERLVTPQAEKIRVICRQISDGLGFAFYSHDILPERDTGRLLVCETGFKFNDSSTRSHMMPLRGQLVFDDFLSDILPRKSAEAFAIELPKIIRRRAEHNRGSAGHI
ncbi:MAG: hypothetical protein E7813_15995 [Bradyrhizobium sp.]|uniref:hypothetical protein n=1 Tax=Bradyrhizobium sp. TaxID=376 RepID=UPI0011FF8E8F|nr:hypothetical protein [Bradyrhizobium sp.]THD65084.1 MAG: hypothetical protein E7813_15995 [Bradyrhizobium sp.]